MTTRASTAMDGRVEFLNPDGLPRNPAFSNVAVVSGSVRTIYVGGQDAVDAEGNIVGIGDIAAQTEQVLRNLPTALAAAGAGPEHVVKWNVLIVDGQDFACRLRGVPASVGRPTQSSGHHGRRGQGPRPSRLPRRDGRDRGRSCLTRAAGVGAAPPEPPPRGSSAAASTRLGGGRSALVRQFLREHRRVRLEQRLQILRTIVQPPPPSKILATLATCSAVIGAFSSSWVIVSRVTPPSSSSMSQVRRVNPSDRRGS